MTMIHETKLRALCNNNEECLERVGAEIEAVCTSAIENCQRDVLSKSFFVDASKSDFLYGLTMNALMPPAQQSTPKGASKEETKSAQQSEATAAPMAETKPAQRSNVDDTLTSQSAPKFEPQLQQEQELGPLQEMETEPTPQPKKKYELDPRLYLTIRNVIPFFKLYGIVGFDSDGNNNGLEYNGDKPLSKYPGGFGMMTGVKFWLNDNTIHRWNIGVAGFGEAIIPSTRRDTDGNLLTDPIAGQFGVRGLLEYLYQVDVDWSLRTRVALDVGGSYSEEYGMDGMWDSYEATYFMMRAAFELGFAFRNITFDVGMAFAPFITGNEVNSDFYNDIDVGVSLNSIALTIGAGYSWDVVDPSW